ncbi:MAG: M48 family metallopeptidase, partial [Candidatus Omnitrophica bacterium]|nr:M48 family metallopeptidase [Candidatus Omnitrophota bacterium]
TAVIGGFIFAIIVWFFSRMGRWAPLYCWIGVMIIQVFMTFIGPIIILPLFNKFTPLEEGELKKAIDDYARAENFKINGIFKMDASKRSTKSNAYFTGFGKYRRIALFDTLIKRHSIEELVSILAHEIGHYKKSHILKNVVLSAVNTGLMFFILYFFIDNRGLFDAFKMDRLSIYAGIVFFSFLYTPINTILSIISQYISRKFEYEADTYAVSTYNNPEAMINALKKLTVDNLINLTPHPAKVFFHYSHPPVLKRIEAIREMSKNS